MGFVFLKNIVAGKTKTYGKLLLSKVPVGPVYVIAFVGNVLILKMPSLILLYTIKIDSWLFRSKMMLTALIAVIIISIIVVIVIIIIF